MLKSGLGIATKEASLELGTVTKIRIKAGVGNLFNARAISKNVVFTGGRTADKAGSSPPQSPAFSTKNW